MGWGDRFPSIKPADSIAGTVKTSVSDATGLPETCRVSVGIHDSNASYSRYFRGRTDKSFGVISTGTWAVTMASGRSCDGLSESSDMLANVDYLGRPVACARFMAGLEYENLCYRLGASTTDPFNDRDLMDVVRNRSMALPQYVPGSGPFSGAQGRICADVNCTNGPALASLYCALMLDFELDLLEVEGDIFLEGAFLKNMHLCRLLSAMRGGQAIYLSPDDTGTVKGAAALVGFDDPVDERLSLCHPVKIDGLSAYRSLWREKLNEQKFAEAFL